MKIRDNRILIFSVLGSAFLLILFGVLKSLNSPVLELQSQWLIVAIVPIIIGLIAGGFVVKMKAGSEGFEFETFDPKLYALPEAPRNTKEIKEEPEISWHTQRTQEFERSSDLFLVHVYKPSTQRPQKYDVFVYLVRHNEGSVSLIKTGLSDVKKAEFFFGASWGNQDFTVENKGANIIGMRMSAFGTYLATCRVTFTEPTREPVILNRYIDFEMIESKV